MATADCLQKSDGSGGLLDSMVWSDSTTVSVKNDGNFPTETFKNNSSSGNDNARAGIEIFQNQTQNPDVQAFLIVFPSNYGSGQTWAQEFAKRFALAAHTNSDGVVIVADKSTGDIRFYTGGHALTNERVRIESDGDVGIGTDSPSSRLHVKGSSQTIIAESGGSVAALLLRDSSGQAGEFKTSGDDLIINDGISGASLKLETQGIDRLVIDSSGKVSIGAATAADLEVTGNIQLKSAGNGLKIKEGTNATMGTATLSDGTATVTVSTTKVTASSRIFLTCQDGDAGNVYVSQRSAGTSFDITRSNTSGSRTVAWLIIEPA